LIVAVEVGERFDRGFKWRGCMIAQRPDHAPGDAAPAAGTYEQLNIFRRPTGIRVNGLAADKLNGILVDKYAE
jgi:hypothetical protein